MCVFVAFIFVLIPICWRGFVWDMLIVELLIVEDCVEDQGIGAEGLSTIDGIVAEQQNIPLTEVRVHDDRVLRNRRSFVEQAVKQKIFGTREAQDDIRPALHRNYPRVIARLLLVQVLWFPRLLLQQGLGFRDLSAQGLVAVLDAAAAGGALFVGVFECFRRGTPSTSADNGVAYVEGHAIRADYGDTSSVAEGDWIVRRDEDAVEHSAHDSRVVVGSHADSRGEAGVNGELRRVFAGDEEAALFDELLQMSQAVVTQARADVSRAVESTEVWSQIRFLPRHRIVPCGDAAENLRRRRVSDRSKNDDVVFGAQIWLAGCGLGIDVVVRHAGGIEGITPPAFGLSVKPGVHERYARSSHSVDRHGWRCCEPRCIER